MNQKLKGELSKVISEYDFADSVVEISTLNTGNINNTFIIKTNSNNKYIIQKINTKVFNEPYILMKNIENITKYIEKYYKNIGDNTHQCLKIIRTKKNESLCTFNDQMNDKQYYRVYNYINNSVSYDNVDEESIVYNAGKGFGNFAKILDSYPIDELDETILDFHNTPKRYRDFISDIKVDSNGRCEHVSKEILYFLQHEDDFGLITTKIKNGKIPIRVTHNDTKINNVMMDKNTGEYICVIDLDTVMPGSILYDYGDGIRSVASTALEDESDLSLVNFNKNLFYAFTNGFLSEIANCLTKDEVKHMGDSILLITNELAMRFLNDYINGDTYFKTKYPEHNLVRARNQLKLANEIKNNIDYINDTITKLYKKYKSTP